jgi:predicted nucleic acid-binding protein
VLALALAAKAELIITGDDDLLSLASFEGIAIVAPAEAVKLIEAKSKT